MSEVFTQENWGPEVMQSTLPVLVDVYADWCGPCRSMASIVDELATANVGRVKVGKLDCDVHNDLATTLGIHSIPAFLVYVGGKEVERLVGMQSKMTLQAVLDKYTA